MSILITCRKDLPKLLPENAVGCELGVFECGFSKELLESGKFESLFMVDPFEGIIGSGDKDGKNHSSRNGEDLWNNAINVENEYFAALVYRQKSLDFLDSTDDNFFDFVYIDTVHTYEMTYAELCESWRTTKPGGIIAGHDFNLEGAGVEKAVLQFTLEKRVDFHVIKGDGLHSFYFFKS